MNVIASHSKGLSVRAKQSVSLKTSPKLKQIASSTFALATRFPRNDGKLKTKSS